jgi:ATP-dependent RNA helicase RhlE
LLKSVAKNTRNSRSNKASETKISHDKSSPYQAKKSKAKVSKIKRK